MTVRAVLLIAAVCGGSIVRVPAAVAEIRVYRLDPAATEVRFQLDATLHKVRGTAALARGEIRFDRDTGEAAGEVVVDARSAETGNAKRDRDMHVKVLESERFPEIVLVVDGFAGDFDPAASSKVVVSARLQLHGAEHPLRLEMTLEPLSASGGSGLAVATAFSVPYVEWGMKDPSKALLRVGKKVDVTIAARGSLTVAD